MDIMVYESGNGGEFQKTTNSISLTSSIWNTIYIALFGGNTEFEHEDEEDGSSDISREYWGNFFFQEDSSKIISKTEQTLVNVVINSQGLNDILEAVNYDLSFLNDISSYEVSLEQIGKHKINIIVQVNQTEINYIWDSTLNEVITDKEI